MIGRKETPTRAAHSRRPVPGGVAGGRWASFLVGAVLAAGSAGAQVTDPVEEARQLFDDGIAAAREQDFVRALELFRRSNLLHPNPTVTFNIGLCHQKMGDAPAAVQAFRDYLEEGGTELAEDRIARTQELIDGLAPQVGAVRISAVDPGGEVFLDGERLHASPLDDVRYVAPGAHTIEGRWPDTEAVEQSVDVLPGIEGPLYVRLVRPEPFLDLPPPPPPPPPPPGDGTTATVPTWAFWTAVGATGAFGLTAILTLSLSEVTYDDFASGGRTDLDLAARGEALDLTTWIMAGLTGAALIAGTVLFFYTDFEGGSGESPPDGGTEIGLLPGSLVVRW